MAKIWPYLRLRLRSLFRRGTVSNEIQDELRMHIEQETLELIGEGWSKREARIEAHRRFGNSDLIFERCTELYMVRGPGPLSSLLDVKTAFRAFGTNPGFTLAAILMIGLGIGATTTIFSVVDHVLLRPLPYPQPEQLVTFGKGRSGLPIPDYVDVRDRTHCFESIGAVWTREQDLTGAGNPERLNVGQLTQGFLSTLGARTALGRTFAGDDFSPVATQVVVLSHGFWQRRLGGSPDVVGITLTLEGQPHEVIGVLARDFVEPEALVRDPVDVWVPLDLDVPFLQTRTSYVLRTVARLASESTPESAQGELEALSEALASDFPEDNRRDDGTAVPFPLRSLHEATVGDVGQTLSVLMGAVGLMLLIACANVANLSLARGTDRSREMALRSALGASRTRLVSMLLTESVVLGLLGGILGVVLAVLGVKAFTVLNAGGIPRVSAVTVDWRVVGFAAALSVFTGILFGLLPAFRAAETDSSSALKEGTATTTGGRSRSTTRDVLVVIEIALALVLLVGAGLLFNSFLHLRRVDPGFNTENVLTAEFRFGLPFGWGSTRYSGTEAKAQFVEEFLAATRQIPGVVSVGGSLSSPFGGGCCWSSSVVRSDRLADSVDSWIRPVTAGYLETIGARLNTGQFFTEGDEQGGLFDADETASDDQEVNYVSAVVNATLARRLWPDESPLGSELIRGNLRARVVGVIDDVSNVGLDRMNQFDLYVPYLRTGTVFDQLDVAVRYRGSIEAAAAAIRQAAWNIDQDLPIGTMLTMDQRMTRSMSVPRFYSTLFMVFATVAFLLAAAGIYASMTYVVGQRRRELGIRLALGGKPSTVVQLVLRRGAMLTGLGVVIGVGGSLTLSRLLESFLFGITTTDKTTFVVVPLLLSIVAAVACFIPARKAAAASPLEVLRAD